jgi:hypothetical protein
VKRRPVNRHVQDAIAPMLGAGERLERSGPAWAVELRGRGPILFRARDLHELVLTDQRMLLFRRPRRLRSLATDDVVLAKRFPSFHVSAIHGLRPLLQLRLSTAADRGLLLEFRPRQRGLGRDLAERLGRARRGRRRPLALPPGDGPISADVPKAEPLPPP